MTFKWSKLSRLRRKELNGMRNMADVPWPPRRFKYPPTSGNLPTNRRCTNVLGNYRRRRQGWRGIVDLLLFRKPELVTVRCRARLELVPYKRRLWCPRCSPTNKRLRKMLRGTPFSRRRTRAA